MRKKINPLRKYAVVDDEQYKKRQTERLEALKRGRETQKRKREQEKAEEDRKKTVEEKMEEDERKQELIIKKSRKISKKLFGEKSGLSKMNELLVKKAGTKFIEVLPTKFKSTKSKDFRIIYKQNKFSRYGKGFTRKNINNFGNHINQFLKDNGIKRGEIILNLNYNGVVRSSSYKIGEKLEFHEFSEYSPTDDNLNELSFFNSINNFDSVAFFISAKKTKNKK